MDKFKALLISVSSSYYYSYDYKNVHYVAICTELDYSPNSPQWLFVQSNLTKAAANMATVPWIIVKLHKPIVSADSSEYMAHYPGAPLGAALGPLFAAGA